jgi:GNAT superfamily N-acetyltransferase
MTASEELLASLEEYYDEVPRASATTEEIGPFTLFLRSSDQAWPYYARPRLHHTGPFTAADVERVRERQRQLGAPESFEWVAETTPGLAAAAEGAGLVVHEHPLMVLGPEEGPVPELGGVLVEALTADYPELGAINAVIGAGFAETDEVGPPSSVDALRHRMADGSFRLVAAFDESGPVGGGSHSPRGGVTELTGISVLPRARRRGIGAAVTAALVADARALGVATVFLSAGTERVAAIYAKVGFVPVATACIAEPPT